MREKKKIYDISITINEDTITYPGNMAVKQHQIKNIDNDINNVPRYALTMGIATIMDAKKLILLASGKNKALAIKTAIEGPVCAMVPASIVQMHPQVILIMDKEAASELEYDW